jgi:hypothetical protein
VVAISADLIFARRIENLGMAALGHENIRGLDVAMDDSFSVSSFQCVRYFDSQFEHPLERQRLTVEKVPERLPIKKLHGNKRLAVVFADLINGANIGMV